MSNESRGRKGIRTQVLQASTISPHLLRPLERVLILPNLLGQVLRLAHSSRSSAEHTPPPASPALLLLLRGLRLLLRRQRLLPGYETLMITPPAIPTSPRSSAPRPLLTVPPTRRPRRSRRVLCASGALIRASGCRARAQSRSRRARSMCGGSGLRTGSGSGGGGAFGGELGLDGFES